MAFDALSAVDIIECMENYVQRVRPPLHVRDKLDIGYKIENQSVILLEVRPFFKNPDKKIESAFAKATYVKRQKCWKVFWMRGNLEWVSYDPKSKTKSLAEFLKLVDEDKYHCFEG